MTEAALQIELFNIIKNSLQSHVSLADEMADLLNLSHDSVYRRIRGEKPIPLHELKLLCEHFNLSLDQVLQLQSNKVLFTDPETKGTSNSFKEYQQGLLQQLQYFKSFERNQILYHSKDVPIFHFFYFRELAAFKSFFWGKSILLDPELEGKKFSLEKFDDTGYYETGKKILETYNEIPSTELWNYESINSTISQIEYYRDAEIFENKKDFYTVVDSLDAMLLHLQKQVEVGRKFIPGATDVSYKAVTKFYINELILGNNNILIELDNTRLVYINYIVLKYIITNDKNFTDKAFNNFRNLISRSILISETGEKERNKFFNSLRQKVQACKC